MRRRAVRGICDPTMRRALLAIVIAPTAAHAAGPLELGAALGAHAFSSDLELGVPDRKFEPGLDSAALLGLRIGYDVTSRLAAEGELVWIPTEDSALGDSATVLGMRAHARFDLLAGRVRPFVLAGMGAHVLRGGSPQMTNDTDRAYHWGAGVRYALSARLDLRFDLRHLIVPDRTAGGATSDFEASLGVTYKLSFARPRPIVPTIAPYVPPSPGDTDGDNVRDDADKCVERPEDRDGFEDSDGCPDLDNDHDDIPDLADTCPLQAETVNGWQDHDGCPDQVIAELAGIAFELSSSKIDPASAPILERAYQLLRDNAQLAVEVSGHTSNEGDQDRNLELSLRRAQAVKEYLVKRGIPEGRILTVGHGADSPVADNLTEDGRRKNRRIEFRILKPEELND
jgi:OmpA-OmpF porin, OOP family